MKLFLSSYARNFDLSNHSLTMQIKLDENNDEKSPIHVLFLFFRLLLAYVVSILIINLCRSTVCSSFLIVRSNSSVWNEQTTNNHEKMKRKVSFSQNGALIRCKFRWFSFFTIQFRL